jgi:hypothetical protein
MSIASSLPQPLIGARADRSSMAWAVPAGVPLGGLGSPPSASSTASSRA